MKIGFVLLCILLVSSVTTVFVMQSGILEILLMATNQHPWIWAVCVFTVGLPIILFVSIMWPDKRFGPPDQQYYYKKSDDIQPDDPEYSQWTKSVDMEGNTNKAITRKGDTNGNQTKSDTDLKDH